MTGPAPSVASPVPRLSLKDFADPAVFRAVWKKSIRGTLRTLRFADLNLAPDALDYVAFESDLARSIDGLCEEIAEETFHAAAPELVRGAKSVGLTRPLAFLSPRDQLTYRVLTLRAENALLNASFPWTRFGRGDTSDENTQGGESGWFRAWLERQNQIWVITSTHEYLVETDVANFFPSIDARAVARHVLANSMLSEDVVDLLEHMLYRFGARRSYRASRLGGLPQEPFDGSRMLAHTYLRPVDAEFEREGAAARYSRWVDDIVVGAMTRTEALQQIQRVQLSLESLDLYPNSAKTRVIRASDFTIDYMKDVNDLLGELDEDFKAKRAVTKRFNLALTAHLNHRHPQPKAWERVLRRFYTLSRTIDNDFLTRRWGRDLRDHPGSADHVLEYMSTHRLTVGRALEAEARLKELGGVYEDVELMTRHYLAIAPNLDGTHLRAFLSDWSLETLRHSLKSSPRLASACAVVVGKFGHDRHMDALADLFRSDMRRDDPARQHSALVLTATGRLSTDDLRRLLGRSSPESVQQIEFLLALLAGDTAAAARGIGSIQPSPRQNPQRAMVRPRSMFLAPLLRAASPIAWTKAEARFLKSLRANRLRHRDLASERWLQT